MIRALVLSVIAGLILLTALAVGGPRLIAQAPVQAELRRLVEDATGANLVVRGRIGIDVLPRPRLSLVRAVMTMPEAGDDAPLLEVDRLDLDIGPLALLGRRLEVRRARFIRPRLEAREIRTGDVLSALGTFFEGDGFRRLASATLVDGAVDLGVGTPLGHLRAIDATARRELASGRISLVASAETTAGEPISVAAEIGEPAALRPTSLRLELVRGADGDEARLDFRGFGVPTGTGANAKGQLALEATSAPALARLLDPFSVRLPEGLPEVAAPLALESRLELDPTRVVLDDLDLRIGSAQLNGSIELAHEAAPRLQARLEATEIDLDSMAETLAIAAITPINIPPGVRGEVSFRADLLRWRGQPVRQVRLDLDLAGERAIRVTQASAVLPGAAYLRAEGEIARQAPSLGFAGEVSLGAEDIRETLSSLGIVSDQVAALLPPALDATASLAFAGDDVSLESVEVRAAGTRLTGSAALTFKADRPRFAIAAHADRVALGEWPPGHAAELIERGRAAFGEVDGLLELSIGRISLGLLRGEDARLQASLERGALRLGELAVASLEQARLRATGGASLPSRTFDLAVELDAPRPTALLRTVWPGLPPTALRFGALAATGTISGRGDQAALEVRAGTRGVRATLNGTVGIGAGFQRAPETLDLKIETSVVEPFAALRDLGLISTSVKGPAGHAQLRGHLRRRGGVDTLTIVGDVPDGEVDLTFALARSAPRPRLDGRLLVPRLGDGLLPAVRAVALEAGWRPLGALGRLPRTPLPLAALAALDVDITTSIGDPAKAASHLMAHLRLVDGRLTASELDLPYAGGRLTGTMTLDRRNAHAVVGAELELTGGRAETLLGDLGFRPGLRGTTDLSLQLASSGRSVAELVGELNGAGHVMLHDGAAAIGEGPERRLASVNGPIEIGRGVITPSGAGLELRSGAGPGHVALRFDLLTWLLELTVRTAPAEPGEASPIDLHALGAPGRLHAIAE